MATPPFFSIVVPVYNAEKYLDRLIACILKQTFPSFELILINDCSTDTSKQICQRYQQKDNRIIFFDTPCNSGASGARNLGLAHISGKYTTFVDVDDRVDDDLLAKAFEYLKDEKADCLQYGRTEEYFDKEGKVVSLIPCRMAEGRYFKGYQLKKHLLLMGCFGYVTNSFYKTELIHNYNIRFDLSYKVNEDFVFNVAFFQYADELRCMDYCGYYYGIRCGESLSHQSDLYTYDAHMVKVKSFLQMFADEDHIANEERQMIFWVYTRLVYSLLIRANSYHEFLNKIATIRSDSLYVQFKKVDYASTSFKQRFMTTLLKMSTAIPLYATLRGIRFIQEKCPVLFAKVKK